MIFPILAQDCETLHLTHSLFRKLEGCQYNFFRTICNKKWEDFVHYTELFALFLSLGMSNDRMGKENLFRPYPKRQAIIQDIKVFDLSDIVLDDNYPQRTTSGQSKLEKRFWVVDDQKRIFCKLKGTRGTKKNIFFFICFFICFFVFVFFFLTSIISFLVIAL